jgi:hypothetical protein
MHAFNPNDPMTWNQPDDQPMPAPSDQPPTTFLSEEDLSALLSAPPVPLCSLAVLLCVHDATADSPPRPIIMAGTPMGTSPNSVEAVQVVQAAVAPPKQPVWAGPEDAREAIAQGLARYGQGDHSAALQLFETALTLPGTGTLRDRKKQRELSEGEALPTHLSVTVHCCVVCCTVLTAPYESHRGEGERALQHCVLPFTAGRRPQRVDRSGGCAGGGLR